MKLITLYKLLRLKPTVAWSVCGILLGVAVAINQFGWNLNWELIVLVLLATVIIQGLLAHAINDLIDEDVDKKTDMKATNRAKVLLLGLATRFDLAMVVVFSITFTLYIAIYLYMKLGLLILLFYAIGLYAPLAYSLPPLKLGWKPFSEWTVVFPVLNSLVIGTTFIASGKLSLLAFFVGVIFSLYNIYWFLISRMMDYIPDKAAGKITTAVKYGLPEIYDHIIIILMLLFIVPVILQIWYNILLISIYVWGGFILLIIISCHIILPSYATNISKLSVSRTYGIILSIVHSVVLSIALVVFR